MIGPLVPIAVRYIQGRILPEIGPGEDDYAYKSRLPGSNGGAGQHHIRRPLRSGHVRRYFFLRVAQTT